MKSYAEVKRFRIWKVVQIFAPACYIVEVGRSRSLLCLTDGRGAVVEKNEMHGGIECCQR